VTEVVLDASALLAFLLAEPGSEAVAGRLRQAALSAVNYAEALARSVDRGKSLAAATADIARLRLLVIPFDGELAAIAASLRPATRPVGLSLADRACLALGLQTGLPVLTANRDWAKLEVGVRVEVIRPAPANDAPAPPRGKPIKRYRNE
jgi:PIN domain nuclease of toxin-antitoxin system